MLVYGYKMSFCQRKPGSVRASEVQFTTITQFLTRLLRKTFKNEWEETSFRHSQKKSDSI